MSLISFSATRSRAAAWLALMAVLLLFVAPVISKSLAQLRGDEMTMNDDRAASSATVTGTVTGAGGHASGPHRPDTDHDSKPAHLISASQHNAASHPMTAAEHSATSYPMTAAEYHVSSHPIPAEHSSSGHSTATHQASDAEPRSPAHQMSAAEHRAMMAIGMMMPFHHPMSMMDDSACGYCVLLIHLALTLTVLSLLWCLRQSAAPPAVPLVQAVVARFVPRFFHPRAPPAVH